MKENTPMSAAAESRKEDQIISYLTLRTLIGMTGALLPVFLPLGCWLFGETVIIQDSISDYYYTETRNIFVGVLFVLGFFLLSYKGYEAEDSRFANFGFVFALNVALFPCKSAMALVPLVHFASAFLLFCVFIWFSLRLFTRSIKEGASTRPQRQRNRLYVACGWIMIVSLVGIGLSYVVLSEEQRTSYNTTYWLESLALWAFGYSWLTKGKLLWSDK